jgi:hypothetical protein
MHWGVGRKQLFPLPLLLAALQLSIYSTAAVRDIHSDHDLVPGELLVEWHAVAALLHSNRVSAAASAADSGTIRHCSRRTSQYTHHYVEWLQRPVNSFHIATIDLQGGWVVTINHQTTHQSRWVGAHAE